MKAKFRPTRYKQNGLSRIGHSWRSGGWVNFHAAYRTYRTANCICHRSSFHFLSLNNAPRSLLINRPNGLLLVDYFPEGNKGDSYLLIRGRNHKLLTQMMIMHHSVAIEMAGTCLTNAYHGELLRVCENIIQTLTAEIEQMQMWLCEW